MKAKFLALAALILCMVSCQTNFVDGVEVDANGEAAVTLQVGLPEDVTRTVSYGNSGIGAIGNLDLENNWDIRYILEVYDSNGTLAKERMINREDASTKTSFSLRLIPGRQYRFVVWADFIPESQVGEGDYHYNTNDIRRILLNNAQLLNDESRDAYTGYVDVDNFKSSSSIALTLKRPFAKLRVVTTDMKHLYTKLVSSKVVYTSKIYTQFNAYSSEKIEDSKISGLEKVVNYSEYDYNETYNETGDKTLFADYLFGSENGTVMFTLDVTDNTSYDIPTVNFNTNIPVDRNHLTTIKGNILTDANEITVTIQENFDDFNEWPSTDVEKLEYAAMFGGEVTLADDVTVSEGLIVRKPMTINLNGHTLTYNGDDVLFRVKEGASLTINGTTTNSKILTSPKTLSPTGGNGYIAVVYEGCTLTFNGGTYEAQSTCTIAQANGGKIYVKGGTFTAKEYDTNGVKDHRYTFNHSDSLKDVGKIEITGGKFYKWNPIESHSENPAMSFIPADYCSYPDSNLYYEVMSWDVAKDKTFDTPKDRDLALELLRAVFRHGGKVRIREQHSNYGDTGDVYLTEALIAKTRDVTIEGSGEIYLKSGVASIYESGVVSALICAKNGVTVTFDDYSGNVTSNGEDYAIETRGGNIVVNSGYFHGAVSAAYALEGTITINGGKFSEIANTTYGAQYLLNCHDANYKNGTANIVVKGGTFVGFNPANNAAEGTGTNFVAAGYTSTPDGSDWKVTRQ
ncbi:MAG: FimB/Mfa2 family fimbrial subunit [Alistipes sp.]|nr:FimB/Mfa2 family fimbrial subunit [Alistipes sp.]